MRDTSLSQMLKAAYWDGVEYYRGRYRATPEQYLERAIHVFPTIPYGLMFVHYRRRFQDGWYTARMHCDPKNNPQRFPSKPSSSHHDYSEDVMKVF